MIAGLVTIIGLIITRAVKVSEFRQAWINGQREDLAEVLASALRLARGSKSRDEVLLAFDQAFHRIQLRENPEKREWEAVIDEIARLRKKVDEGDREVATELAAITSGPQVRLKREWNRVREGEIGSQVGVGFGVAFLVGLLLWLTGAVG